MKKFIIILVLFVLFAVSSAVLGYDGEPNDLDGISYYSSGTAQASGSCPSWFIALDRDGKDGVHENIVVELDGCEIIDYEVYTMEQGAPKGYLADLEQDDIFVVWDEDYGHGSNTYFSFSGKCTDVTEDTSDYVKVSSPYSNVNWRIYRVTVSGTLTITDTGYNEHDAFHLDWNLLDFEKTDDVNSIDCAGPGDELTYTICYNNTSESTFENAYIVDYLPEGVDFVLADPNYNQDEHTYTWELGTIAPDDSGCVSLTVTVNEKAEPGMYVHNMAELRADPNMLVARATEDTPVCCWGDPNIIYVDKTATGSNIGISWLNAYSGEDALQQALRRAGESKCEGPFSIYVAEGTYRPGDYTSDSFRLPEGSRVYGGFMTGGSDAGSRNPDLYKTVLTGYTFVDDDPNAAYHYEVFNDTVVTMVDKYVSDANFPVDENTLLDGFTITDATEYGIYGTDVDFTIKNCMVTDSGLWGIYASNNDVTIKWSKVNNNDLYGIEHTGEGNAIVLENSQIINNKQYGIFSSSSTLTIKNSVVLGNGYDEDGFYGIRVTLPTEVPVLYNNTIVYNAKEGVYCYDDANNEGDPNHPDYPDIQNSILYYNNSGAAQVTGFDQDACASYCDIEGGNEVNNNINDAPGFMLVFDPEDPFSEANPYHYHLAFDSPCKDMGNPNHDANDVGLYDLDGEDRIANGRVDIGADENNLCDSGNQDDIFNDIDWNLDGTVDSCELVEFAGAWLSHDPNDPGIITDPNFAGDPDYVDPETLAMWRQEWDPLYNLDGDYDVDYGDFAVFAQDWLWRTCWKQGWLDLMEMMAMGGGEGMMMSLAMDSVSMSLAEPATEQEPAELAADQLASLIERVYGMIEYFDTAIEEGYENAEELYEMKAFLEGVLLDLQAEL
jgi:uncharacterized repeat protein (TIGR01451 family)